MYHFFIIEPPPAVGKWLNLESGLSSSERSDFRAVFSYALLHHARLPPVVVDEKYKSDDGKEGESADF